MKKQIFVFALLFTFTSVFGHPFDESELIPQDNSGPAEHMTFKGVPIDGTLDAFVLKMKQKGFTPFVSENGMTALTGDFAAYKGCTLVVATLENKDLVSRIMVLFPETDSWPFLASNYFNLKELLTEKYGKPSEIVEKFDSYSEPKDDNAKMNQVNMNRCKYYTTYETDNGSIELSIENTDYLGGLVSLKYSDNLNGEIIRAKALDDL
jgi:hypothetical protein